MKAAIFITFYWLIIGLTLADAQEAPRLLPFQGRLTDHNGTTVSNGVRMIQFKIFTEPSSGSPVWSGEVHRTTVNAGLVNLVLGTRNPLTSVDFNRQLFLEITVDINGDNAITPADPPMLPRQIVLPVIFAKESGNAQKLAGYDWSPLFGSNDPVDGRINGAKLADGSIPGSKIGNQQIHDKHVGFLSRLSASDGDPSPAMAVDKDGNIGIGTIEPKARLHLAGHARILLSDGWDNAIESSQGAKYSALIGTYNGWDADAVFIAGYNAINNGNYSTRRVIVGAGDSQSLVVDLGTKDLHVSGVIHTGSDRDQKTDLGLVDADSVLAKLCALPIRSWAFTNSPTVRHIGPMAQDFAEAFRLGVDDKHIATVDADGVAFAAIQGMARSMSDQNDRLLSKIQTIQEQKDAEIEALRRSVQELQARLDAMMVVMQTNVILH